MDNQSEQRYYKTRVRTKGQITLPVEVRRMLKIRDGDDLVFGVNEKGQLVVDRARTIPPDQAWFWTERWQKMEKAAQADVDAGKFKVHANLDEAISHLESLTDAANRDH